MARQNSPILCAALLAFALGACGDEKTACDLENICPLGSYCVAGECMSECDPTTPSCPGGAICTRHGRCVADQPDPAAGVCAALVLDATFGIPTIMLLVDQSRSMTDPYAGDTRWVVLRDALINPTTGVVARLQTSMRFGLTLYTYTGGPTCPMLTTVAPKLNNLADITTVYGPAVPELETPTGESIDGVVQVLDAFAEPGPKYIILASDGEPDTCADPTAQNGQPEAVAAAQNAYASGITLYFISVGSGTISQQHMQDVANAGVGLPVGGTENAPYYEASDDVALAAAFDEITSNILTCDINVNGVINADAAEGGVIFLDGNRLAIHQEWEPTSDTSFRLMGDACLAAQRAGDHTVTAHFGCDKSEPTGELSAEGGGIIDGGCSAAPIPLAGLVLFALIGARLRRRRLRTAGE